MLNFATWENGPELTGFGLRNLLMSATFENTCLGTMKTAFRLTATNCESLVFSAMTTWLAPFCLIEAMFVPSR